MLYIDLLVCRCGHIYGSTHTRRSTAGKCLLLTISQAPPHSGERCCFSCGQENRFGHAGFLSPARRRSFLMPFKKAVAKLEIADCGVGHTHLAAPSRHLDTNLPFLFPMVALHADSSSVQLLDHRRGSFGCRKPHHFPAFVSNAGHAELLVG